MFYRILSILTLSIALSACAGTAAYKEAKMNPAGGSAYTSTLYSGYINAAYDEIGEMDDRDGERFANKASEVSARGDVDPDTVASRRLDSMYNSTFEGARARIMTAKENGGKEISGAKLARAQIAFDCWIQEQEEGYQPRHIEACRERFRTYMADVEREIAASARPAAPSLPQVVDEPAPVEYEPVQYTIYFDFDSARLNQDAIAKLISILAAIDTGRDVTFAVDGHADRSGPDDYNQALSASRAEAVVSYLVASGIPRSSINTEAFGEHRNEVETADGVKEPRNRRAHIVVR